MPTIMSVSTSDSASRTPCVSSTTGSASFATSRAMSSRAWCEHGTSLTAMSTSVAS